MTSNVPGTSLLNTVRARACRTPASRFETEAAARATGPGGRSTHGASRRPGESANRRTRVRVQVPCELHDPDLWFADAPGDLERAKVLCGGCPAQPACLIGAIERREPTGVWGGQILDKGEIVSHKRPRGRPRKGSTVPQRRPFHPLTASVARQR
jgi:WhiB family redox-sensing transcriptional regulator